MTDPGEALADAALGLIGCRFRLHGRDPATGLDCVGVVSAALAMIGVRAIVPSGYGLRNSEVQHWLPLAQRAGLVAVSGPVRPGDILLIALDYAQHHLAVAAGTQRVIHAHAGLRRVVLQPLDPAWQVCAIWRLAPPSEG